MIEKNTKMGSVNKIKKGVSTPTKTHKQVREVNFTSLPMESTLRSLQTRVFPFHFAEDSDCAVIEKIKKAGIDANDMKTIITMAKTR